MSSDIDELPSSRYRTDILSEESSPGNEMLINKDEVHFVDQLTDQFNPSQRVYGNVTMIDYVYKNISQVDKFLLIAPGDILKILLDYPIYLFPQVIYVYAYYDNANNLERDKNFYQKEYPKIKFVHERNAETQIFEKLMVNHAISSLRLIERETLNSVVSSMEQRISTKRSNAASCHSKKPKILSVATDCICPYCKLIFREPYQLNCGHRCCESCINFTDNKMICLTCSEVSTNENIRSDRGFSIDMQQQSISCSICTWVGSLVLYQV
ncbi:unnamed protein product [Rotaria sp. Silwood2]|nr:unnamed protein product [Rotaria sp. Silwood2]